MNTALWSLQAMLAALFLLTGTLKLTRPAAVVRQLAPAFPLPFLRGVGALEILGAVGIILPTLTGIWPVLTPLAAAGMSLVLVAATALHSWQHEFAKIPFLLFALAGALLVLYGRS